MKTHEFLELKPRRRSRRSWRDESVFNAVTMPKHAVRVFGTADQGRVYGWQRAMELARVHTKDDLTCSELVAAYDEGVTDATFGLVDRLIETDHWLSSVFSKLFEDSGNGAKVMMPFDVTLFIGDVIDGHRILDVSRKTVYVVVYSRIRHWDLYTVAQRGCTGGHT